MRARGQDRRPRRRHSKIAALPEPLREQVHALIVAGHTYEQIAAHLAQLGHPAGKSSVGRYAKDFLARLERLKIAQQQAEAIVTEVQGRPALELEEANTKIAMQMIMEFLATRDVIDGAKAMDVLHVLAKLQTSASNRERTKLAFKKRLDATFKKLEEKAQAEAATPGAKSLDPDTLRRIKEDIYGLIA